MEIRKEAFSIIWMKEAVTIKIREEYTCPLEIVHDIIRGKWKTIILWQLGYGRTSLSKLQQDIEGISQKMLLEQLKELMEFGLVAKESFEGYPLRVEYYLTEGYGKKVLDALRILQDIGIGYMIDHGQEETLMRKGIYHRKTDAGLM